MRKQARGINQFGWYINFERTMIYQNLQLKNNSYPKLNLIKLAQEIVT